MKEHPRYKETYRRSHPLRTTVFILFQLVFIPILIVFIRGLNALLNAWQVTLPPLLHTAVFFLAFAVLYVGLGYFVAGWVRRRIEASEPKPFDRPYDASID